jgi:hypothetical protein
MTEIDAPKADATAPSPTSDFEVASLKNPDYVRKFDRVIDDLQDVYSHKIRPLEKAYNYEHFSSSAPLGNDDIAAKPMVLLIGQYSTVSVLDAAVLCLATNMLEIGVRKEK